MACGVPVVASPVGVNNEIIEDGVSGLLANTEAEWRDRLARLIVGCRCAEPNRRAPAGAASKRSIRCARLRPRWLRYSSGPRKEFMPAPEPL